MKIELVWKDTSLQEPKLGSWSIRGGDLRRLRPKPRSSEPPISLLSFVLPSSTAPHGFSLSRVRNTPFPMFFLAQPRTPPTRARSAATCKSWRRQTPALQSIAPSHSESVLLDPRNHWGLGEKTQGQLLLSFNPNLKTRKGKKKQKSVTQSSGLQIRNQIQPGLEETPLKKGWHQSGHHKAFLELLCCF